MASYLKHALSEPVRYVRRQRAKVGVRQLTEHHEPRARAIGEAILSTINGSIGAEERDLIEKIEQRRASLLSSSKTIQVVDYGAGKPSDNRSKAMMQQGVISTESVAKITMASKPKMWATMLFNIIRQLKPDTAIELGTCVGISAAYQSSAMKLNGRGCFKTLEGAPEIADIARDTIESLHLDNTEIVVGPFHETFTSVLKSSVVV